MYFKMIYLLPEIIISVMSCFILIIDLFISNTKKNIIYYLSQFTLFLALFSLFFFDNSSNYVILNGAFLFDSFCIFTKQIVLFIAIVIFIYSKRYMIYLDLFKGEYFVLCLLSILGMMLMISCGSFLSLFLSLELLSLPLYALIVMNRSYIASEASIKYFIMGSVASAFFLFGVSLIYGMTGDISFSIIYKTMSASKVYSVLTFQIALVFLFMGLIFKFGGVPFHMWIPDVYEGSVIPVTVFIATIPKIAALSMIYRLLTYTFSGFSGEVEYLFIAFGVLSLFFGNIFALTQINIKRLLGYSAIAHVGFMCCGLTAAISYSFCFVFFYVLIYVISSLGAFGVLIAFSSKSKEMSLISQFKGLGTSYPLLGIIMLLFLLSLAGIPPTAGFYAKFFVLKDLIAHGYIELALFVVLMSVVGSFYYLKVIKVIFFDKSDNDIKILGISKLGLFFLILNGFLILFIGIFPSFFLQKCIF